MTSLAATILTPVLTKPATWSSHIIQNIGQQDGALHGNTAGFEYGGVFDGHGSGPRKHLMRDLLNAHDWDTTLQTEYFHKIDKNQDGNFISPLFAATQHLAHNGQDELIN